MLVFPLLFGSAFYRRRENRLVRNRPAIGGCLSSGASQCAVEAQPAGAFRVPSPPCLVQSGVRFSSGASSFPISYPCRNRHDPRWRSSLPHAHLWSIARLFHESLGGVPPPHRVLLASASGPMVEEMLFRGILFWLIFELLRRGRVPKLAAVSATILVIAVGFAFSHGGRTGLSLYTTILTGIAFGWMRAQSESTAAAALMHAVYNLVLSYLATF